MDIIELIDSKNEPDPIHDYSSVTPGTPLIIDNGSYKCRVGWSSCAEPLLTFRNFIAKPRKDRKKDRIELLPIPTFQVGNDIVNIEAVRGQLKTQFERNVITHFHTQEEILDYIFEHLGINSQENVPHPIFLTEAIGNPNFCRQRINELLFETYGIPALSYGIDSILSLRHNKFSNADALIISFGYHTTHVVPVLDGEMQASRIRRLNIGGYHIITYLFRLMQMKYPVHLNAITVSRMETLIQQYGSVALDYQEELKKWSKIDFYDKNVRKIQLPFTAPIQNAVPGAEQKMERRKELTRRLVEANAKRTRERFLNDEKQFHSLNEIRAQYELGELEIFEKLLQESNIAHLQELDVLIKDTRNRMERTQKKMNSSTENTQPVTKEETVSAVAAPPAGVSVEEWVSSINLKRDEILKKKHLRKVRRQDLAKRKTAAAQERMRIISQLARNEKGNDEFGMNDNDWDIYKTISRDDSESETESEQLLEYETILRQYDPTFEEPVNQQTSNFTAEHYQLHFGVEAIRCPEILFQPSMVGNPEAGLAELIEFILKFFTPTEQQRLVNNVFLTGGCAQFPGLKERLSKELTQSRPFQSTHNISVANLPELDAWLGACDFAKTDDFKSTLTSKEDYMEKGAEFFRTHQFSNKYFPTPLQE